MARRRINLPAPNQGPYAGPTTTAGDAMLSNEALRQQNVGEQQGVLGDVQSTFGDPMHGIAVSNAQRNLLGAQTDVSGMGAVLQGIKNVTGGKARVGFQEPDQGPSSLSPASWNPAGMTQDAATRAASNFAKGGEVPDWFAGAAPDTQQGLYRRAIQSAPDVNARKRINAILGAKVS